MSKMAAATVAIPAGSLWLTKEPKGWNYSDKAASWSGVKKLQLKTGSATRTRVQLMAGGVKLPLPSPASDSSYFDSDPNPVVQRINSEGLCWTSRSTPANTSRNNGAQFKAKTQ